jgi:peptidase E
MIKYEKIMVSETEVIKATLDDNSVIFIPIAEDNSDYQAYLNKDKPQTPMVIDETPAE